MALTQPPSSDFVSCVYPLRGSLTTYDSSKLSTNQEDSVKQELPENFLDAMHVREEVYVKEQGVSLENELDADDERSFHWVAYASMPREEGHEGSTRVPIGTIRLVPAPNPAHPVNENGVGDQGQEPYVKLGRLAVLKDFRKMGISKLLILHALAFVAENPDKVRLQLSPAEKERAVVEERLDVEFKGLVLVHSQTGIQKVWAKYGFVRDENMGNWDEEGIDHVGMWKRVDTSRWKDRAVLQ